MSLIQMISLSGSLFFLWLVLYSVYRSRLREAYALVWIFVAFAMIVLSVSSKLLHFLAGITGIQTPAFALLLCLCSGMLLMIFQCTIVISLHQQKLTRLTQEVTILKEELDRAEKKLEEKNVE